MVYLFSFNFFLWVSLTLFGCYDYCWQQQQQKKTWLKLLLSLKTAFLKVLRHRFDNRAMWRTNNEWVFLRSLWDSNALVRTQRPTTAEALTCICPSIFSGISQTCLSGIWASNSLLTVTADLLVEILMKR